MIRGIHHVAITTNNLDRLLAFYRDVIGLNLVDESDWERSPLVDAVIDVPNSSAKVAMLRAGNAFLEIFQYLSPAASGGTALRPFESGYTHLSLDIVGLEAEVERLKAAGMRFAKQIGDFGVLKAIYGYDPDGNVIELQEIIEAPHPYDLPLNSLAAK
jgi:catechol 2,3-dioxygenase-like lactoylglutathione lyase family enzyme